MLRNLKQEEVRAMFEIPECVTIAGQMAQYLSGKCVAEGTLGNSPHKFAGDRPT